MPTSEPTEPTGPAAPPRRRTGAAPPSEPGSVPAAPSTDLAGDLHDDHDDIWLDEGESPAAAGPGGPVDDDHWDDDDWDDHDDHDYVDLPGGGSVPKWAAVAGVLVLLLVLVIGGGWVWYGRQVDPPGSPGEAVTVQVPSGVSVRGIGTILEDEGVISNATVFNWYAGRKGAGPFQAGAYELRRNSDFDLVLDTLDDGPVEPLQAEPAETVSIPEGLTVDRVLARIAENVPGSSAEELRAALDSGSVATSLRPSDQASYEGLLFPATYEITDDLTGIALLEQMAVEMEERLDRLGVDAARQRLSEEWGLELTDYDFLKVASMVQAEAGNVEEASKIATVIYNRLADGMALGIDAVDRYGAELAGTDVDYNDSSLPYNTRRRTGLPPTPISAPGEFAIAAALQPESGPWLYYVLQEERTHVFVTTNAEFLEAKQICIERDLGCG